MIPKNTKWNLIIQESIDLRRIFMNLVEFLTGNPSESFQNPSRGRFDLFIDKQQIYNRYKF